MLDEDTLDYFRFAGVRALLEAFRGSGVPRDARRRNLVLEPAIRSLWYTDLGVGSALYELGGQARALADRMAADPAGRVAAAVKLPAGVSPGTLYEIAGHVEAWRRPDAREAERLVATSGELMHRFPRLRTMLDLYFGQDGIALERPSPSGEWPTARQALQVFVDDVHTGGGPDAQPLCLWTFPGMAAECQEALAVFQTDEHLERFFEREHMLGSSAADWGEWIPMIRDTLTAHMREHHPPVWRS